MTGLDLASYLGLDEEPPAWNLPIEHWSATSLGMLARCPEQYRHRYILGEKERPGEALVIGTAVHRAAEFNFVQKIKSGADITLPDMEAYYGDVAFPDALSERQEQGDEVAWDTDPDGARRRGRAITVAYHTEVAPRVQPLSAETRVEADWGLPVPVIGYADVRTTNKIIDIKTSNRARSQIKPEWRIQAGVYSGITEQPVDFHCVSATKKDFRATVNTPLEAPELSIWLPAEAREAMKHMVQVMSGMAVAFMEKIGPDNPWPTTGITHPWACSWCSWKPTCVAWKGVPA